MTDHDLALLIKAKYDALAIPGSAPIDDAIVLPLAESINAAVGGASTNHSALTQLDYASAGHTGFQPALGYTAENASNKDTDVTMGGATPSNTKYPTQLAAKTYIDQIISASNALVYKGVIDCTLNPDYPSADCGHLYVVSVAGKIGGASGVSVEVGDILICNTDSTPSGNQATVGSYWNIIQKNIDGAVTGPASSTDSNIVLFDSNSGKVIKDSSKSIVSVLGADDTTVPTSKAVRDYASSSSSGTNKRLGCLDIDGSTNTVDTDYGLYTVPASTYAKNVKVYICNRNGGYTARIRLAHVDGAVGDIAVEDYILFDDYLLPYETKIVELDGMVATDTLLVRSSVSLVNFEACGEELTTDVYRKRVGALDIDGATNAINTDKVVYTSDRATKVNVLICNRNSGYVAECQIAHVNSNDIANIADEDRKYFTLDVNQSLFLELDLNMAIDEIISFRSDTINVNCLVYQAE